MKIPAHIFALSAMAQAAALPALAQPPASAPDWRGCTVIHIAPDGARTVRPPSDRDGKPPHDSAGASASASTHQRGPGSASSRSSVSASSSSGGRAASSASASAAGGDRRQTVTRTDDARGCVVTIDER